MAETIIHTACLTSDVVYNPDSPYCLLGIPFLAAYFAKRNGSDDRFDGGTCIKSGAAHSQFVWDGEKHERNFDHGDSLRPELWLYQGTTYFTAFCTRMRQYINDKIDYAFSSAFSMSPNLDPKQNYTHHPTR
jgi:hypothetical protein